MGPHLADRGVALGRRDGVRCRESVPDERLRAVHLPDHRLREELDPDHQRHRGLGIRSRGPGRSGSQGHALCRHRARRVWVSFDDGSNWQRLQRNLPPVPVHDLAIKEGDLVAATHGRGFWILDDLSVLRQLAPEQLQQDVHLFKPRDTYRIVPGFFFGGGSFGLGRRLGAVLAEAGQSEGDHRFPGCEGRRDPELLERAGLGRASRQPEGRGQEGGAGLPGPPGHRQPGPARRALRLGAAGPAGRSSAAGGLPVPAAAPRAEQAGDESIQLESALRRCGRLHRHDHLGRRHHRVRPFPRAPTACG